MKGILKLTVAALALAAVTTQVQLPFAANSSSLITAQARQGGHHGYHGHRYYEDRPHHNTCPYGCEGYGYHHEDCPFYDSSDALDYSLIFDPEYYAENNPDVAEEYGTDAAVLLRHFVEHGMDEKRRGCEAFDIHVYMDSNPDLQELYGDEVKEYYVHYLRCGHSEDRKCH